MASSVSTAFFLGSLGFLGSVLTNNWVIGYMLPVCYYFICYGSGKKYLGNFYLFSLVNENYMSKIVLFVAGVCIIIFALSWYYIKNKKIGAV